MSEKQSWIIVKHFEAEADYAASLDQLPGEEEDLATELPVIINKHGESSEGEERRRE